MMEKIIIPYRRLSDKARKPKLSNVIDGKFIYNLQSAENGIEILRNVNFISTHLVISIPRNMNCHLKSFFYENDGTVIYDYNLNNGLTILEAGSNAEVKFPIPDGMAYDLVKKGDFLGCLIFSHEVTFTKFIVLKKQNLLLKYKLLSPMAKPPQKLDSESAGYDLTSAETHIIKSNSIAKIATDLALEIPAQCYGRIASRSGIALNNKLNVFAGVIDRSYRGNIFITLFNHGENDFTVNIGDRIAQIIIEKMADTVLLEAELDSSSRGEQGFGSTGLQSMELNFDDSQGLDFSFFDLFPDLFN